MIIFNSLLGCLLAFTQLQLGQAGVIDPHRIVSGDLAQPGEIKYIVVTLHDDEYYMCGGGIISNFYVLSAAHCFLTDDEFLDTKISVVAGVNDYNKKNDPRRVEVGVEKVFIPKKYTSANYPYDIALLKLKKSLNVKEHDLEILALPTAPANLTNRMALMAGFGYDQHKIFFNERLGRVDEHGTASGFLRKADIKLYDNKQCQALYPRDRIYTSYICGKMVKESQRREYGVCNGDSGSPLVYNQTVVGVVSWSYGCDERDVPLVYTRVSSYLDFIEDAKNGKTLNMQVKTYK